MQTLERIFERVKAKGWSKSQFAAKIGKNTSITSDWKLGRSVSYLKMLPKIAAVLDTSEAYLRGETDNPEPETFDVLAAHSSIPINMLSEEDKEKLRAFARFLIEEAEKNK